LKEYVIVRVGRAGSIKLYRVCELLETLDLGCIGDEPLKVFNSVSQPVPYGTAIARVRELRAKQKEATG
jgi:hypothetical protein